MKCTTYISSVLVGLALAPTLASAQDAGTPRPGVDAATPPSAHAAPPGSRQDPHAAGELAAGELAAGELAAGELAAGELAAGELAAGELAAGEESEPRDSGPAAMDTPSGSGPGDARSAREATDLVSVLSELFLERTERAEAAARRAAREARRADEQLRERDARPAVSAEPVVDPEAPLRVVDASGGIGGWSLPDPRIKTAGLTFLILLALLGVWVIQRLRRPLPGRGLLPRLLGVTHIALRVLVVVMATMIVSRLLPEWLRPALLLAIGAVALAVGAGTVVVLLPDIVGGLLLVTEGRIKAGLWIEGEGFRGTVLHIGPRLTVLRIPDGTQLTIPNRRLVRSPIHAVSRRWHEVETELDVRFPDDAAHVRGAIVECVVCSPFVPVQPAVEVTRDPRQPTLWKVRTRLLDAAYEAPFRGQLLERVEDALRGVEAPRSDGSQPQISERRAQ